MSFERITYGAFDPIAVQQTGTLTANASGAMIQEDASSTFNESVSEAMALADAVSGAVDFPASISESVALSDAVSATGSISAEVAEALTLSDDVSAAGSFTGVIAEGLSLTDAVASSGAFSATITEEMALEDDISSSRNRRIWFLSFADVTPPPEMQGPGNPGKLKGDYREDTD